MDESNPKTGEADYNKTASYKYRTLAILNTLIQELYPLSDNYAVVTEGTRPVPAALTDLSENVPLDDGLSLGVLPFGLAGWLIMPENGMLSSAFLQQYNALKERYANRIPSAFEDIEDAYGGIEYGEFASWS